MTPFCCIVNELFERFILYISQTVKRKARIGFLSRVFHSEVNMQTKTKKISGSPHASRHIWTSSIGVGEAR